MGSVSLLKTYFPGLTPGQLNLYASLGNRFLDWNQKVNLISRKDSLFFFERHVLHSLFISKVVNFEEGTKILDLGTGGGFPGLPLAIFFPQCEFVLVDSIAKKINVVNHLIDDLALDNVKAITARAESIDQKFDFVVSRAVARLIKFMPLIEGKFRAENKNSLNNGLLYLKGGELGEELNEVPYKSLVYSINNWSDLPFFETKKLVYIPMNP